MDNNQLNAEIRFLKRLLDSLVKGKERAEVAAEAASKEPFDLTHSTKAGFLSGVLQIAEVSVRTRLNTLEGEYEWYENSDNVRDLMEWLVDAESWSAKEILHVLEKPWHYEAEWNRRETSG